jgi:hypothetical protein
MIKRLLAAMLAVWACAGTWNAAVAQTAQKGADAAARTRHKVEVEYVHYRPARWEKEQFRESETEFPNQGGLAYVYLRNVSDKPVQLAFWRINGKDESYWRLNHITAWDRTYQQHLDPGEMTVTEIVSPNEAFAPDKPFKFAYVDRHDWAPVLTYTGTLTEDPVRIANIHILPGLRELELFIRHTGKGKVRLENAEVHGQKAQSVDFASRELDGPDNGLVRITLEQALTPGALLIVRLDVRDGDAVRPVYAHRRAFEDCFPIGTWGATLEHAEALRHAHVDTAVLGGGPVKSDEFQALTGKFGFRAMTHTGVPTNFDTVHTFGSDPAPLCWMIQDEPDWSIPSDVVVSANDHVAQISKTAPTMITLCRDMKFPEYASIPDIPCQDHYCVTAPSSSVWKKMYGTRLEETAWYTRDLKEASEPKPIWVWSQGIAGWGERPKQPNPTPEELGAQLVLNLGRGAKGVLWFTFNMDQAKKYPDSADAMRGWGRVMYVLRDAFLASDIALGESKAPDKIDVASLYGRDMMIVCVTNTDYDIDVAAYPFREKKDVDITVRTPDWITPKAAVRVSPEGVETVEVKAKHGKAKFSAGDIKDCGVFVLLNDPAGVDALKQRYQQAVAEETKGF